MKKTRRKRSVMILGQKIKIKYTSKVLYSGSDELHGAFDADTMTIHISNNSDIQGTILHELTHAALWVSGAHALINDKTEEAIVLAIENSLKQFFTFK